MSFRAGGVAGLRAGEELGAVAPLPKKEFAGRAPAVQRDWIRFLWETEERYWTGMRRFIREDLHCGSLVVGTQNNYSPFAIQAEMDVTDCHAYWQHPYFPGRPWDPVDWIVHNVPMAGVPDGGTLRRLLTRAAGKPFVCTEYNHPAPNTYSSEAFLLLGAYAALHDLDGIFAFAYSHGADWNHGTFANFFDIAEHPTKMVALPAAAALFERGDVRTADKPTVVRYTTESCIEVIRKIRRPADRGAPRRGPGGRFQGARRTRARARCRTCCAARANRPRKARFLASPANSSGAGDGSEEGLRDGEGASQQSADRRCGRAPPATWATASRSRPARPCRAGRPSR